MYKTDRRRRLIDLLPKLTEHLHSHAAIKSPLGRLPEDPEGRGESSEPAPDCDCGKPGCKHCDELWVYVQRLNDRKYPMDPVKRAFVRLCLAEPLLAQAVWHEYVEPWDEWNPQKRRKWAYNGVDKMLGYLGDTMDIRTKFIRRKKQKVHTRKEQVRRLQKSGMTQDEIAKSLKMSKRDVSSLLKEGY